MIPLDPHSCRVLSVNLNRQEPAFRAPKAESVPQGAEVHEPAVGVKQEVKGLEKEGEIQGSTKRGRAEFEESLAVNETPMPVSLHPSAL